MLFRSVLLAKVSKHASSLGNFRSASGPHVFLCSFCSNQVRTGRSLIPCLWTTMATSSVLSAKRALVSLLLGFAAISGISFGINRESTDEAVTQASRKVAKKTHPDKGDSEAHAKN